MLFIYKLHSSQSQHFQKPCQRNGDVSPGQCGSVGWESSCRPNGGRFDSLAGHMPGLQVHTLPSPLSGINLKFFLNGGVGNIFPLTSLMFIAPFSSCHYIIQLISIKIFKSYEPRSEKCIGSTHIHIYTEDINSLFFKSCFIKRIYR